VKRRILSLFVACSLLLFVAAAALWLRSHFAGDAIIYQPRRPSVRRAYIVGLNRNIIGFATTGAYELAGLHHMHFRARSPDQFGNSGFHFLGFQATLYIDHTPGLASGLTHVAVIVPLWMIMLASAIAPAMWLRQRQHRRLIERRQTRGLCPACGYDCSASPNRCPECGAILPVIAS
jgi:hypothetical protein